MAQGIGDRGDLYGDGVIRVVGCVGVSMGHPSYRAIGIEMALLRNYTRPPHTVHLALHAIVVVGRTVACRLAHRKVRAFITVVRLPTLGLVNLGREHAGSHDGGDVSHRVRRHERLAPTVHSELRYCPGRIFNLGDYGGYLDRGRECRATGMDPRDTDRLPWSEHYGRLLQSRRSTTSISWNCRTRYLRDLPRDGIV